MRPDVVADLMINSSDIDQTKSSTSCYLFLSHRATSFLSHRATSFLSHRATSFCHIVLPYFVTSCYLFLSHRAILSSHHAIPCIFFYPKVIWHRRENQIIVKISTLRDLRALIQYIRHHDSLQKLTRITSQ